ncbi:MAG TPA: hypothetical protein DCZ91_00350 [Lachnospiraceae bacterium]|nr:hypothetical protein [Lachnospiraceae bacterium]
MLKSRNITYTDRIRRRIRLLYLLLISMVAYMALLVELGGGDSRIMTQLAQDVSRLIFFGGMIYVISRIVYNKKLLKNRMLLKEQMLTEQDERNRYLHDKSGGTVMDILLVFLMFMNFTASLFDMAAFYSVFAILVLAVVLKAAAFYYYGHFKAQEP